MYTFIVLGILPGTNFQITFDMWLDIVASFFAAAVLIWTALALIRFYRFTDALFAVPTRTSRPATQLHQRGR